MPFIGILDGEKVVPEGVENGINVSCPECGEQMHPWGPSIDGRARHFQHKSDRDCATTGGESAMHRKLKSIAVSKLRTIFDDRASVCEPEVTLDAPKSEAADRRADALVRFDERDDQLGKGLIIEVQYKNKGKDRRMTELDYLAQEYSVVWVTPENYSSNELMHTERTLRLAARHAAINHFNSFVETEISYKPPIRRFLDFNLTQSEVPARIPAEYFDRKSREIWESQEWHKMFSSRYESTEYILDVRLTRTDSDKTSVEPPARKVPARLPGEWYSHNALELWRGQEWESLFNQPTDYIAQVDHNGVDIDINIKPFLPEEFWKESWSKSAHAEIDIERPRTRFDDVQCHKCGHYEYAPTAGTVCLNCGNKYNWSWNVMTDRISKESIPSENEQRQKDRENGVFPRIERPNNTMSAHD